MQTEVVSLDILLRVGIVSTNQWTCSKRLSSSLSRLGCLQLDEHVPRAPTGPPVLLKYWRSHCWHSPGRACILVEVAVEELPVVVMWVEAEVEVANCASRCSCSCLHKSAETSPR